MPKKALPPQITATLDALVAPLPPSPIVQKLRTDWRWAAISQFLWTFSDAFGLVDWDIENLENDLDGDETRLIPDLIAKLLYALTYNRQINSSNAFENLRKQYLKRHLADSPFGTLEEPIEWATLGLSRKVLTLWELCEWQLDDPAKFRALLPNEDESAAWRIEPLGWDKSGDTYFLFDDNRLWIQRLPPPPPAPPRPPKKSSLKAKKALKRARPSNSQPKKSHRKRQSSNPPPPTPPPPKVDEPVSGSRKRTQVTFYGNVTPTVLALKRGGMKETPPSSRGTRSSHRLNGDAEPASSSSVPPPPDSTPSKTRSAKKETPISRGTRVSRRLRDVDDEWQQVPEDWLANGASANNSRSSRQRPDAKGKGKQRAADEESELSELTDEEEHQTRLRGASTSHGQRSSPVEETKANGLTVNGSGQESEQLTPLPPSEDADEPHPNGHSAVDEDVEMKVEEYAEMKDEDEARFEATEGVIDPTLEDGEEEEEEETDEIKLAVKEANNLPEGFVEWEAVCVTLYDWQTFPEQFKKSKDPDEKALYTMLTQHVGPTVIEALVAKEQERLKQEAINNRKRSSRILARDLEKEETLKRETAQREMEERMDRQRREEERQVKEEADALAREKAREDRLREREDRAAAREDAAAAKVIAEQEAKDAADRDRESRKRRRELGLEDWEGSSREGSRALAPLGRAAAAAQGDQGRKADDRWELNCEVCRKNGWNIDGDEDLVCCDDCGRWQHTDCHNRLDASEGRPLRNWDKVDFRCKDCRRRAARKRQRLEGEPNSSPTSATSSSRPAPPPDLKPGEFYLPYPPAGQSVPPAGYAVYYPPTPNGPNGAAVPAQQMAQYRPNSSSHVHPQPVRPAQPMTARPPAINGQPRPIQSQPSHQQQPYDMQRHASQSPHGRVSQSPSVAYPSPLGQASSSPQVIRPHHPSQSPISRPQQAYQAMPHGSMPAYLPTQHAQTHNGGSPQSSQSYIGRPPQPMYAQQHPAPGPYPAMSPSARPSAQAPVVHGSVPHMAGHPFAPQPLRPGQSMPMPMASQGSRPIAQSAWRPPPCVSGAPAQSNQHTRPQQPPQMQYGPRPGPPHMPHGQFPPIQVRPPQMPQQQQMSPVQQMPYAMRPGPARPPASSGQLSHPQPQPQQQHQQQQQGPPRPIASQSPHQQPSQPQHRPMASQSPHQQPSQPQHRSIADQSPQTQLQQRSQPAQRPMAASSPHQATTAQAFASKPAQQAQATPPRPSPNGHTRPLPNVAATIVPANPGSASQISNGQSPAPTPTTTPATKALSVAALTDQSGSTS